MNSADQTKSISLEITSPICYFSLLSKAHEKPLTESHVNKLNKILEKPMVCNPDNNHPHLKALNLNYPSFTYTIEKLKNYLNKHLSALLRQPIECFLVGGAAHPNEEVTYNDIDIAIYLIDPDYKLVDMTIKNFIISHIKEHPQFDPETMPLYSAWIIQKAFYKHRTLFNDSTGALYGLRENGRMGGIDIKILKNPQMHSVGPTDGVQVSLNRYIVRYSLGERFAETEEEFQKADRFARQLFYEVQNPEKVDHLLTRLLYKWTQQHVILAETLQVAKKAFRESVENSLEGAEKDFCNHYLNHYPTSIGKICDFLNLLFFHQADPNMCRFFAHLLLRKKEEFGLKEEANFATLIFRYPFLAPHLLSFIGCVTYGQSVRKKVERKGDKQAIECRYSNSEYPSMLVNEKGRIYRIGLGWPLEKMVTLVDALPKALKILNVEMNCLRDLFKCFQIDCAYLTDQGREELRKLTFQSIVPVEKIDSLMKGLEVDAATVQKEVPTELKAIFDYVKSTFKGELTTEEVSCKAIEMGLIPDIMQLSMLQKLVQSKKLEILETVYRQLQLHIEKSGNTNRLIELFCALVENKDEYPKLDELACQTVIQIHQKNRLLFELCCKDEKLVGGLLKAIRKNTKHVEVLEILLEATALKIEETVLTIFNEWVSHTSETVRALPLAIKFLERKLLIKPETQTFWILKIAIKNLYDSQKKTIEVGQISSDVKEQAIKLLTLMPAESHNEIRSILLERICHTVVKQNQRNKARFSVFTQALIPFLASEHVILINRVREIDFKQEKSEILTHLIHLIDSVAPKLKEKSVLEDEKVKVRQEVKEKKEKKKKVKDCSKLVNSFCKIINENEQCDFNELFKRYTKILNTFLKEKSEKNHILITNMIDSLVIYTESNALEMATHLYQNIYDYQLLPEDEIHKCGMKLIRGYVALKELNPSFICSDTLIRVIKRVCRDKKLNYIESFSVLKGLRLIDQLKDHDTFDHAFNIVMKIVNASQSIFFRDLDKCLHDLLSAWRNEEKYFNKLIKSITAQPILMFLTTSTFSLLFKVISSSKKEGKEEIIWNCFKFKDKDSIHSTLPRLLEYLDRISEEKERIFKEIGINLLETYEKEFLKVLPEDCGIIETTRFKLYASSGDINYVMKACEIYAKKPLRNYKKVSELLLDAFLAIPLENYTTQLAKAALNFINKLAGKTPFIEIDRHEMEKFNVTKMIHADEILQVTHSSKVIRVLAYFSNDLNKFSFNSEENPKFSELFMTMGRHLEVMIANETLIEEPSFADLLINLSKKLVEGTWYVISSDIIRLYEKSHEFLHPSLVKHLQEKIEKFLNDEYEYLNTFFQEITKKLINDTFIRNITNEFHIALDRMNFLRPLYILCYPEKGKEVFESFIDCILHISQNFNNVPLGIKFLKRAIKDGVYTHQRKARFKTEKIVGEKLEKNMLQLNLIKNELALCGFETANEEVNLSVEEFLPDVISSLSTKLSKKDIITIFKVFVAITAKEIINCLTNKEHSFDQLNKLVSKVEEEPSNMDLLLQLQNSFLILFYGALFSSHVMKIIKKDRRGKENSLKYLKGIRNTKVMDNIILGINQEFVFDGSLTASIKTIANAVICRCDTKDLELIELGAERSSEIVLQFLEINAAFAKRAFEKNKDFLQHVADMAHNAEIIFKKLMGPIPYRKFEAKLHSFIDKYELEPLILKFAKVVEEENSKRKKKKKK